MRPSLALVLRLVACVSLLGLAACDPPGPGAAGEIALPDGASTNGFMRLAVIAFPYEGATFDPIAIPDDHGELLRSWVDIEAPGPWAYEISDGFGGSAHEHWRVVAWLATDSELQEPVTRVPAHARYATRSFSVDGCGIGVDGYCGTTHGVDLVLDQLAPE